MDKSAYKSNFVTLNGIRLHYLDWGGSGPVILFLPGLGCNAYIFDQFAPRFTDKFHVLGLTRRGHGDSDYPETGYDIDTLVEDIRQFMDGLNISQVILVGHSMAGIELSHFAAIYPERVTKLVFLDAAYDRSSPEYKAIQENYPMKGISIPGENEDYYNVQDYIDFIKKTYTRLGEIWSELMDEHIRHEIKVSEDGKIVDKMSDAISKSINETMINYVPEDAKILVPTLSIYVIRENSYFVSSTYMSEQQQAQQIEYFDTYFRPWERHCIEQFQRNVPHAKIVEIPNGHHYCFIKQDEIVFREMRNFLMES
jgi:pimeloyl-ACP methyl ester carboxylesterase